MLGITIDLAALAMYLLACGIIASTARSVIGLAPGAHAVYRDMAAGHVRPGHALAAGRFLLLLRKGPRAVFAVVRHDGMRMTVAALGGLAIGAFFIGSLFFLSGGMELVVGLLLGVVAVAITIAMIIRVRRGYLLARVPGSTVDKLKVTLLNPRTSRLASRIVLVALVLAGALAASADYLLVGTIRALAGL